MKNFKHWTRQNIANKFGLDTKKHCKSLENWLQTAEISISEDERKELTRLQKKLVADVDIWNEQELIIKFIALLIDKIDVSVKKCVLLICKSMIYSRKVVGIFKMPATINFSFL